MLDDPQVIAAIVIGICTISASIIAALAAAVIGRRFQNQKQLKADLRQALSDIEFLLAVEKQHGELHLEESGQSNIRNVRAKVKNQGFEWSQKFTPGRAKNLRSLT